MCPCVYMSKSMCNVLLRMKHPCTSTLLKMLNVIIYVQTFSNKLAYFPYVMVYQCPCVKLHKGIMAIGGGQLKVVLNKYHFLLD